MNELNETEFGTNETANASAENMTVEKPVPYKFKADSGLFWLLIVFGLCFIAFILVFQVVLTPIKVVGVSMQPTINSSVKDADDKEHCDIVYFSKEKTYNNNDIVIVSNVKANTEDRYINASDEVSLLIKRVIAVGGQTVKFTVTKQTKDEHGNQVLYYSICVLDQNGNDICLDQSYLDSEMFFTHSTIIAYSENHETFRNIFLPLKDASVGISTEYHVKENCYFVMGDNRNDSGDSRLFGEVANEDITGKVHLLVPYGKSIFSSIWTKLFGIKFLNEKWLLQAMAI